MRDLTLVGLTEDKSRLVLVSDSGEEFTLPADAKLKAVLRGDHARLGQLEIQMDSALRPRDIQARIRSGESPEAVAQAAQTTVDRIMGYAMPVLAERAHIAERAQRASVRRKGSEGPARILGDAVAERLRSRNVDPESVEWDAWRREDGRWALVADYRSGERARRAEFVFDAPGRYVVAQDDEARWLTGEQTAVKGPQPRAGGVSRRLSAVVSEEELPLGSDAIGMVNEHEAEESTVDLTRAAEEVRRHPETEGPAGATGDADWIASPAADGPHRDEPAAVDPTADESTADESPADGQPAKKPTKKGRRAVPSWDEIMFGGGRSD